MSVAKIAISVAGGGPWMSFALDAFDTAFSVATGEMSLGDGAMSLAKGAASTVASSAISGLGDKLTGAMGSAGFGGIVSTTVSKVATSYANTYATAAINSFSFKGGFHFDKSNFKEMSKGAHLSALKAGAMALTTSIVSESLGGKFEKGKNGWGYSFRDTSSLGNKLFYSDKLSRVSRLAGSVSGQLVDLAAGNGFKVNILNTKDLVGLFGSSKDSTGEAAAGNPSRIQHQGLLELTLGGKKGFELALGGGGLDVSASAIASISDSLKAASFQWKSLGSQKGLADIAYANGQFYAGQSKLANDIVNGSKTISYDITKKGHYGHAGVETDKDIIHLNKEALNYKDASTYGSYIGVMAREGFLIDQNRALMAEGGADSQGIFNRSTARALTLDAFKLQSSVLNNVVNRMGIQLKGEHSELKDTVDYVARTGDLSEFETTGRDWKRISWQKQTTTRFLDLNLFSKNHGKYNNSTLYQNKVSFEKGDKIELLLSKLGGGTTKNEVQNTVIGQLSKVFPDFNIDKDWSDDRKNQEINKYLGKLGEGDMSVTLNYTSHDNKYYTTTSMYDSPETQKQLAKYKDAIQNWSPGLGDTLIGQKSEAFDIINNFNDPANLPGGYGFIGKSSPEYAQYTAMLRLRETYDEAWDESWDSKYGNRNFGAEAASYMLNFVKGKDYQGGGGHFWTTDTPSSFDCSGGIQWSLRQKMDVDYPLDQSAQMMYDNIPASSITRGEMSYGDIAYYQPKGEDTIQHVVMYLGNGEVMNASGYLDKDANGDYKIYKYPRYGNDSKTWKWMDDSYSTSKVYYRKTNWKELYKKYGRR